MHTGSPRLFILNSISSNELKTIKEQINSYKLYEDVIHKGELYRLASPFEDKHIAFEYILEKENVVLLFYFNFKGIPNIFDVKVKLKGLKADRIYISKQNGERYSGESLIDLSTNCV